MMNAHSHSISIKYWRNIWKTKKLQITKNQKKVIKLEQEINDSLLADEYKVMGELILSNPLLKEKTDKVDVYNYYTNETQTISLDPKYDVITNSQK